MYQIEIEWYPGVWIKIREGFETQDGGEWQVARWKQANNCTKDPFRVVKTSPLVAPIVKCKECGEEQRATFIDTVKQMMVKESLCFTCLHWYELSCSFTLERPDVVRINHKHYMIGPYGVPAIHAGFGGDRFSIKFFDGRTVTTANLWHQGEIPERWWNRLPDNAEFVRSEK